MIGIPIVKDLMTGSLCHTQNRTLTGCFLELQTQLCGDEELRGLTYDTVGKNCWVLKSWPLKLNKITIVDKTTSCIIVSFQKFFWLLRLTPGFSYTLTLSVLSISESCIEVKIKLNFYFHNSLGREVLSSLRGLLSWLLTERGSSSQVLYKSQANTDLTGI